MCDLSICQEALNRDPVLYLDLTEAVRRGEGHVVAALPHGALAAFRNYGRELGFTMFADDLETAQALLSLLPPDPGFLTVHEDIYRAELQKRFGFDRLNPCWQLGWLRPAPPPPARRGSGHTAAKPIPPAHRAGQLQPDRRGVPVRAHRPGRAARRL